MQTMLAYQAFEGKKRLAGWHLDPQPRWFPWPWMGFKRYKSHNALLTA
jgi:hypothetical protein